MCSSVSGPVFLSLSSPLSPLSSLLSLIQSTVMDFATSYNKTLLIIAERRVLVLGPPTSICLAFGEECKPEGFMSAAGMFHKLRRKLIRLCWLCEDDIPHSSFSGCVNTLGEKNYFLRCLWKKNLNFLCIRGELLYMFTRELKSG